MNAFQLRELRKILGRKSTYWDRTATNNAILEAATDEAYRKGKQKEPGQKQHNGVERFGEMYKKEQTKLLGHIVRSSHQDPRREVTLGNNNSKLKEVDQRRVV